MATIPTILRIKSDRASYGVGDAALLSVEFSEAVSVQAASGLVPVLALSNGAVARYDAAATAAAVAAGGPASTLIFKYVVGSSDRSTGDLNAIALSENGVPVISAAGVAADVTVRSGVNADITHVGSTGLVDNTVMVSVSSAVVDLVAPKLVSMTALSKTYTAGQALDVSVSFDEAVVVNAAGGVPTLTLSAGGQVLTGAVASYVSGSGSKNLTFRYEVQPGVVGTALDVTAVNLNGGTVSDYATNMANLTVTPGLNNLARYVSLAVDGNSDGTGTGGTGGGTTPAPVDPGSTEDVTPPVITRVEALQGNGTYKTGETVSLAVQMSEVVDITISGSVPPVLILSNGGVARYISGSGTSQLRFDYTVRASDRNTSDLGVLGLAHNDAKIADAAGNAAVLKISGSSQVEGSNLSWTNDIVINAQAPYVRAIEAIDKTYIAGQEVVLQVTFSEAVDVRAGASSGTPTIRLSNGGVASYVRGAGSNTLEFKYVVKAGEASSADLDAVALNLNGAQILSTRSGNEASTVMPAGLMAAANAVQVDNVLPQGEVTISDTALKAGETATVTVSFSEAVKNPREALIVRNGTLSDLVTDETGQLGRVWKGTFTPAVDTTAAQNEVVLDNTLVQDLAGNFGQGMTSSQVFAVDTLGPIAQVSSQTLATGVRLLTLNFGETVTNLQASAISVSGGTKGVLTKVSESVYTLAVQPIAGAQTLGLSIGTGAVQDQAGNNNRVVSFSKPLDETAPTVVQMNATPGAYTEGDVVQVVVKFSEAVNVTLPTDGSRPFLALNNGQTATYVGGTGSQVLTFSYTVAAGDEATRLDALALVENGAGIKDAAGNAARLQVIPGSNSIRESLSIDALVPRVSTISAPDGLYEPGDVLEIEVRLSEAVTVDTTAGRPQLALSNGALATYESGSGSARLVFKYVVQAGDNDDLDLDVTAIAENGAVIKDAAGNAADVAIRGELNTLAYRSDVRVDSAYPQVTQVSANAGAYKAGDVIEMAVLMSKSVSIDRTQGPDPTLLLSNGAVASFDVARSGQNRLIFKYQVTENDTQTQELKVLDLRAGGTVFKSVVTGALANLALPGEDVRVNGLPLTGAASTPVQVDLTAPQVQSITLADTELKAGESTTVTVRLSEAIKALPAQEFTVSHGALGPFQSADGGLTWQATYTPVRDVSDASNAIVLNSAKLSDMAGNLAVGQVSSANYEIDSLLPTVAFASDVVGKATGQVRVTLTFSEPVTGFEASDLVIEGGTLEAGSLEGPEQGLPEGTYSVLINPNLNSDAPIKVRLGEGAVQDAAGNANAASQVFVQPVDTRAAEVLAIESQAGAYKVGAPLELAVRFTEAVKLSDAAGDSPLLMLSNGEYAAYVSGSGSDRWVFRYVMQNSHDEVSPLKVLALVEEQNRIIDLQGNLVNPRVGGEMGLQTAVSLDKSDPAIASFTVVNGSYRLGQTLWIKAELTESVTMTGPTGAKPQLNLTNGGTATYVSGAGSRSLLFKYVVQSSDTDSADLGVSGVTLNGATLQDAAGNTFKTLGAITTGASGNDMAASHAVVVDKTAPQISQLTGVNGYYKAGTTIALQVTFDEVVNVTIPANDAQRKPMLTLSNGAVATYVGGSGSRTLSFEYTVAQGDLNRDDLAVLGLSENGATLKDAAGNNAWTTVSGQHNLAVNHAVVVDTKAPLGSLSDNLAGTATDVEPIRLTLSVNEPIKASTLSEADFVVSYRGTTVNASGQEVPDTRTTGTVVAGSLQLSADGRTATVDVVPLDRFKGDVTVSVAAGAFTDLAGNLNAPATSQVQAVDTQTVNFIVTPTAGQFLGSNAQVYVYDSEGLRLTNVNYQLNPGTGQVTISVGPTARYPQGYRGAVVVEVRDTDAATADYRDEFTNQNVSLATGNGAFSLKAMVNVTAPGDVPVTVSPLTDLAATKVGLSVDTSANVVTLPTGQTALADTTVAQFNDGVGKIFGVADIVATPVITTLQAQFNATDGINASEAYGQALAMLSARDSISGSVANTITELAAQIRVANLSTGSGGTEAVLAITQTGAERLVQALTAVETLAASQPERTDLAGSGVDRNLIEVLPYIPEASGSGLNLSESNDVTVPVKDLTLGQKVWVQWGTQPMFSVVVTSEMVAQGGVPVPQEVVVAQGDANDIAVRVAMTDSTVTTAPTSAAFSAPVLIAVDVVPPEVFVGTTTPTGNGSFVLTGTASDVGLNDRFTVLVNNNNATKYVLTATSPGVTLTVDPQTQKITGWSLDLAVAVPEGASAPAFLPNSGKSVFQVDASTGDLVGNSNSESKRNEVIIDTVANVVDTTAEQDLMASVLAGKADSGVDTQAEVTLLASAVNDVLALKDTSTSALASQQVREVQTLTLGSALTPGVYTLSLGGQTVAVDLSNASNPTPAALAQAIAATASYADAPYTVEATATGLRLNFKAYGPQTAPASAVCAVSTSAVSTAQASVSVVGDVVTFAKQEVAVPGTTVAGAHVPSTGLFELKMGALNLSATTSAGATMASLLNALKADADYAAAPFTLALNTAGTGLMATWKTVGARGASLLSLDLTTVQLTETPYTAVVSTAGEAPLSLQQIRSLDIAAADTTDLGAVGHAVASELEALLSPTVVFARQSLTVGQSSQVTITFPTPISATTAQADMAKMVVLAGGDLSQFTTSDGGKTWQARFVATGDMPNTALQYETNAEGLLVPVASSAAGHVGGYAPVAAQVSQIEVLRSLVARVADADQSLTEFASPASATVAPPGVQVFANAAIEGVSSGNLSAVQDALASTRSSFDPLADVRTQVQEVVDSYNAVLDTATNNTGAPTAGQYQSIGVTLNSTPQQQAQQVSLLAGVVAAADTAGVDTVAEVQALANAANAVLQSAISDTAAAPTVAQINALLDTNPVNTTNASAVNKVIKDLAAADLDTYAELSTRVNDAVQSLAAVSQAAVSNNVSALSEVTYAKMGVDRVTGTNAAAISDAVKNSANTLSTLENVQQVVDSYNSILNTATNNAGAPAAQQYEDIGVVLRAVDAAAGTPEAQVQADEKAAQVAFLAGAVAQQDFAGVDTVAEVQALAQAAQVLIASASDNAAPLPTVLELNRLGLSTVNTTNLSAVQKVIQNSTLAGVDSYEEVAALVSNAVDALALISTAATTNSATGVTVQTYASMGASGVSSSNLASINDAMVMTGNAVTTLEQVQAVIDSYNAILATAQADAGAPLASDYTNIGVVLSSNAPQQVQQLSLLAGAVAAKTTVGVNTVAKVQALADVAQAVLQSATSDAATPPTKDDFNLLLGTSTVTTNNESAVQKVLKDAVASGVDTYAEVSALVGNAVNALADVAGAALSDNVSGLSEQTYLKMGVERLSADNLGAVNTAIAATGLPVLTLADVQAVVDSYQVVLDAALDANASAPSAQDYARIGVNLLPAGDSQVAQLGLMRDVMGAMGSTGPVDTVAELQALADATSAVMRVAAGEQGASVSEAQMSLLGITVAGSDELAMLNARLALAADNGSETDTKQALLDLLTAGRNSLAKITAYANADGLSDYNQNGVTATLDAQDVPRAQDYLNIGLASLQPDAAAAPMLINSSNVAAINERLAATDVGADAGDFPANTAAQIRSLFEPSSRLTAILKIAAYAQDNGADLTAHPAPTAADFQSAGVSGVTTGNVAAVRALLAATGLASDYASADSVAEIQSFVKQAAVNKIAAYANADGVVLAANVPELQDYLNAGLSGVTPYNLATANQLFAATTVGSDLGDTPAGTAMQQQAVLQAASAKLVAVDTIAHYAEDSTQTAPAVANYAAAQVTGVSDANLADTNAVLAAATAVLADTTNEIQALVRQASIDRIAAWADAEGAAGTPEPSLQDYTNAGLTRVTVHNLGAANELFAASTVADGAVSTVAAQQAVLDTAATQLAAINKIGIYATAATLPTTGVPTAADYDAALVQGVSGPGGAVNFYSNIAEVNAALRPSTAFAAPQLDTTHEIQQLVAPAVLMTQSQQYQQLGATAYQNVGSLFSYTTGPYPGGTGVSLTQAVFDAGVIKNTGATLTNAAGLLDGVTTAFYDYYNTSVSDPAVIGWVDRTNYYTQPNLLDEVRIYHRTAWTPGPGRLPSTLDIEGYDALTGQWSVIRSIVQQPLVKADGSVLSLTTMVPLSDLPAFQTYEVGATRPYDGYRIKVYKTVDEVGKDLSGSYVWTSGGSPAGSMLGPNEVMFMAQQVSTVNIQPSIAQYNNAGLTQVDAQTWHATNEALLSASSASLTSMTGMAAIAEAGTALQAAKLALITAYANGTSSVAPTAADYFTAGFDGVTSVNLYAVNKDIVLSGADSYAQAATAVAQGLADQLAAVASISAYAGNNALTAPDLEMYRMAGLNSMVVGAYVPLLNAAIDAKSASETDTYLKIAGVVEAKLAPLNTLLADLMTRQHPSVVDTAAEKLPYQEALARFYQVSDLAVGADASAIGLSPADLNLIAGSTVATPDNLAALTNKLIATPDWTGSNLFKTQYQVAQALQHKAYIDDITVTSSGTLGISAYTIYASDGRQAQGQNSLDDVRVALSGAVAGDTVKLYNGSTQVGTTKTLTATDIGNGFVSMGAINAATSAPVTGHAKFSVKVNDADQTDVWDFTYGTAAQALSLIAAAANGDTATADYPTVGDYAQAGVTGVAHWNLNSVNSALDMVGIVTAQADTAAEVQAIVDAYSTIMAAALQVSGAAVPTASDYAAIGVVDVTGANVAALNALLASKPLTAYDQAHEIQGWQHLKAFADSGGTSTAPTAQDYANVGVSGVSASNLLAVNHQLVLLGTGHGDTASLIQPAVTAGNAALATIEAYNNGNGTTPAALTAADYTAAGVVGVTEGNLKAVNYQVLNCATGGADSNPELASLVSTAVAAVQKIENYNNGANGVTTLTVQDYTNAGIVNVTAGNLSEVNAQVLGSATGAADTCDEIQGLVALSKISAYALDSTLQRANGISTAFFPHNLTGNGNNDANSAFTYSGWADGQDFHPYYAFDGVVPSTAAGSGIIEESSYPAYIGWRDITANAAPNFLKDITLTARAGWTSRFPKTWTVEGYTADTQQWVELKAFNLSSNPNTTTAQTYAVDATRLCTGYRLKFTAAFTEPLNLAEIGANVQGVETRTLPTLEEYALAGITGLDAHSLHAMNAVVDAYSPTGVQPLATFTALVPSALAMQASNLASVNTYATSGGTAPTLDVYLKAGALGMTSAHLNAVNAQVDALSGVADTTALQTAVTQGVANQVDHLATVQHFVNGDAGAATPALTDYVLAGYTSVNDWGQGAVAVANLYLKNQHAAGMASDYSSMFNKLADLSNALTETYNAVLNDRSTHTASSFDTAPEQAALKSAVLKYAAVVQMYDLAEYSAQSAVQLTEADVNLLLGDASTFATSANLNDIIAHIAHETVLPKSTVTTNYTNDQAKFYEMSQVIKADAFVESVVRDNTNDNEPSVVVHLVDAAAGDKLELFIDGNPISIGGTTEFGITQAHVDAGKITFGANEVSLSGKDSLAPTGRYDYSVKVVHDADPNTVGLQPSTANPTVESEAWKYTYG